MPDINDIKTFLKALDFDKVKLFKNSKREMSYSALAQGLGTRALQVRKLIPAELRTPGTSHRHTKMTGGVVPSPTKPNLWFLKYAFI